MAEEKRKARSRSFELQVMELGGASLDRGQGMVYPSGGEPACWPLPRALYTKQWAMNINRDAWMSGNPEVSQYQSKKFT